MTDISNNSIIAVEERSVPFHIDEYIKVLRQSEQFTKANVWSKVIMKELITKREHLFFFLEFAEEYAVKIGDMQRPFSVSTWERAYELWESTLHDGRGCYEGMGDALKEKRGEI